MRNVRNSHFTQLHHLALPNSNPLFSYLLTLFYIALYDKRSTCLESDPGDDTVCNGERERKGIKIETSHGRCSQFILLRGHEHVGRQGGKEKAEWEEVIQIYIDLYVMHLVPISLCPHITYMHTHSLTERHDLMAKMSRLDKVDVLSTPNKQRWFKREPNLISIHILQPALYQRATSP